MSEHINFNKELIYKKESTLKKNEVLAETAKPLSKGKKNILQDWKPEK